MKSSGKHGSVQHGLGSTEQHDDPICQEDVLRRWSCLSAFRLLRARRAGEIAWISGPRQKPFYRPSAVKAFVAHVLEKPSQPRERNAASMHDSKELVLPPELEEHVGMALLRKI